MGLLKKMAARILEKSLLYGQAEAMKHSSLLTHVCALTFCSLSSHLLALQQRLKLQNAPLLRVRVITQAEL